MTAKTKTATPAFESDFLTEVALPAMVAFIGVLLQINYSGLIGFVVLLIGFFIGLSAGWSKDPRLNLVPKIESEEAKRWVQATSTEIAKLKTKIQAVDGLDSGCFMALWRLMLSLAIFLLACGFVAIATEGMPSTFSEEIFGVVVLDLVFLGIWYFWICVPSTWKPNLIEFKLPVFEALLGNLPAEGMGRWGREYQLGLAKAAAGEVPTDLKLLLKPPDAPPEFLGIQAQISINRGGPYLYFVVITKGLEIVQPSAEGRNVIERKNDKEVNILVIRQYADKHGGYITDALDQVRLLRIARQATEQTLVVKN